MITRLPSTTALVVACGVFPPVPAPGNGAAFCFFCWAGASFFSAVWATSEPAHTRATTATARVEVSFFIMGWGTERLTFRTGQRHARTHIRRDAFSSPTGHW